MTPANPDALAARVSDLEAENAQLTVERNEAQAMRRWNIDRTGEGEVLVCRGHHDKGEDCDHERFVPEDRATAAETRAAQLQAEVEALKEEHARYRASAEEMWETAKRHGARMLAEMRRADVAEAEVGALREALEHVKAWIDTDLPAGTSRAGTVHRAITKALDRTALARAATAREGA